MEMEEQKSEQNAKSQPSANPTPVSVTVNVNADHNTAHSLATTGANFTQEQNECSNTIGTTRNTANHLVTTGASMTLQQDQCLNSMEIENDQPGNSASASLGFHLEAEGESDREPLVRRRGSPSAAFVAYARGQYKGVVMTAFLVCLVVVGIALTIYFYTKDVADRSPHDSNNSVQANNKNNIVINNNANSGTTLNNTEVNWGPWGPWTECVRCAPANQLRERKCFKASGVIAKDVEDCAVQRTESAVSRACTGLPPCDPCKVHYRRKCFWLDFQRVNYTGAEEICRLQGSRTADIESKALYDRLVAMVKEMMPYNYGMMSIWTAMKMEFVDRNVTLSDDSPAPYVKWAPNIRLVGSPPLPEAVNPYFARLLLEVDRFNANRTGLSKYADSPDGVICQRDTSSFT